MSGRQRGALLALALVVAIVAIIVVPSLGDDDETAGDRAVTVRSQPPATTTAPSGQARPAATTIRVRDGKPVGGFERLSYDSGDIVDVVVVSDTADEIHVHGYDITRPLPAGRRTRLRFRATLDGIYEIELHESGERIAELRVQPS